MDLRNYPVPTNLDERELLSLWWYQPYIFSDDIASGLPPRFVMKGLDKTILKRSESAHKQFNKFWKLSYRSSQMYQDWGQALLDYSGVEPKKASVFELACNTGFFLFWLKEQGIANCVGIDQADLGKQREILKNYTGINDIDFREGRWDSESHKIDSLGQDEQFDLTICTAFAQHISDPLHLIKALSERTKTAMLYHTSIGYLNLSMRIAYRPTEHHKNWGDTFPNNLDTRVSRKLLYWSLRECGFKDIIQLNYSPNWLSRYWYYQMATLVCLK